MNRSRKPTGLVSGPLRLLLSLLIWSFANRDTSLAQSDPAVVNAPTFHYDSQRTGWNSNETVLTPANVASPQFGALWNSPPLDSVVLGGRTYPPHLYATPLYVDAVLITGGAYAGGQFSAVFAATTNNYVYAINAFDSPGPPAVPAGTILWSQSLGTPTNSGLDGGVAVGILGTPIIDLSATPPRLYVAADAITDTPRAWKVFALDLGSGNILPGWPLTINNATLVSINQNSPATFQSTSAMSQRGALNLSPDGTLLYVPFGAYGDGGVGWMVSVDTTTPSLASAFAYALDANTMQLLWSSTPSQLNVGGKYNHATIARAVVFVGTDRIQAFGIATSTPKFAREPGGYSADRFLLGR